MTTQERVVALDVGEKRIGVALGDSQTKIAVAESTLANDDSFLSKLGELIKVKQPVAIVLGLPRNLKGQETKQSEYVREFAKSLNVFNLPIAFQDESLTSVEAKTLLKSQRSKNYNKEQIDSKAAALILSDYLERKYA
jgi:putative Holliday junction resolvase